MSARSFERTAETSEGKAPRLFSLVSISVLGMDFVCKNNFWSRNNGLLICLAHFETPV